MSFQKETPKQRQPYELDYNEQLRQAYFDCVVSLNALESLQASQGDTSIFRNEVSWARFHGTVAILHAMILDSMKDEQYMKDIAPRTLERMVKVENQPDKYNHLPQDRYSMRTERYEVLVEPMDMFHAITELFHRVGVFKERGFVGHL